MKCPSGRSTKKEDPMAKAEQSRESARRRQANKRARAKGMPEPYPVASVLIEEEEKVLKEQEHVENLAFAQSLDESGKFYRSECRPAVKLLGIYEGNNYVGTED